MEIQANFFEVTPGKICKENRVGINDQRYFKKISWRKSTKPSLKYRRVNYHGGTLKGMFRGIHDVVF